MEAPTIVNTYDQLMAARKGGLPDIAICPHHTNCGRTMYRSGWHVYRPGYTFDPQNEWRDGPGKKFTEFKTSREEAFAAAVQWAGRRYRVAQFVRNRSGDFVDYRVNELYPLPKRERKQRTVPTYKL